MRNTAKYCLQLPKIRRKGMVAKRIPRIIMQRGVDILPTSEMASRMHIRNGEFGKIEGKGNKKADRVGGDEYLF